MGAVTFTGLLILRYDILFRSGVPDDINIIRLIAGGIVLGFFFLIGLPFGLLIAFTWTLKHVFGVSAGDGGWNVLWISLAYGLFFYIPSVSLETEKKRTLRILYLIFIGLIIVSAAGCIGNPMIIDD